MKCYKRFIERPFRIILFPQSVVEYNSSTMSVQSVIVKDGPWDPVEVIEEVIQSGKQDDPFYVMDIGELVASYNKWTEVMPRVKPFYAVKCNPDHLLVKTLAELGTGFDCASKVEMEQVTALGVSPKRIIFANPAKSVAHIRYASQIGVNLMTFDSEYELVKIKALMPHAQMVLRIRYDAVVADHPLGDKFGCDAEVDAPKLLKLAAALNLSVVGVSFHVGSGTREFEAYGRAIQVARAVFDEGASMGHSRMKLLDIGGGFLGSKSGTIDKVAAIVNRAIQKHFPEPDIEVIAEPGMYFAKCPYTIAVQVYAKRERLEENGSKKEIMYYINDGAYGSFAEAKIGVKYDLKPLKPSTHKLQRCTIWGPTCDSTDYISRSYQLPPLSIGDWLIAHNMGAYTLSLATTFNGFHVPRVIAVVNSKTLPLLQSFLPISADVINVPSAEHEPFPREE